MKAYSKISLVMVSTHSSPSCYPISNITPVKEHLNIVFIGHVDAGKSTLGGNLLYLTGVVDKRTMEKYEHEAKEAGRETWYLSWVLDATPQERSKGKTVEVGRAYFETLNRRYTILDAPGHKTYVPSMISGAAQADVAILVISARKGEFETGFERGGQTREHVMLVKTVGVSKVVVVINKMDDSTVNWEEARFNEIKDKLVPFIKASGFNPKDVTFIPISAYTGLNLKDPIPASTSSWWKSVAFLFLLKCPVLIIPKRANVARSPRPHTHGRSKDQCPAHDADIRKVQRHGCYCSRKDRVRSYAQRRLPRSYAEQIQRRNLRNLQ